MVRCTRLRPRPQARSAEGETRGPATACGRCCALLDGGRVCRAGAGRPRSGEGERSTCGGDWTELDNPGWSDDAGLGAQGQAAVHDSR
jgi:hypothetical protein